MTNGPRPQKRAQKCAGDFWFVIILSGAKKMFSEPNINTSPLLEKGAKGKIKYFDKKSLYEIACTCNTPY
jgi:hypothetical protein